MIARAHIHLTIQDRLRAWERDLAVGAAALKSEAVLRPLTPHGRRQLRHFATAAQLVRAARFLVRAAVRLVGEP